jgi:hypothetical protein
VRVTRLAWLSIPTTNYTAMVWFLLDAMGLRVEFDESATTGLTLPNDDRLQVSARVTSISPSSRPRPGPGASVRS